MATASSKTRAKAPLVRLPANHRPQRKPIPKDKPRNFTRRPSGVVMAEKHAVALDLRKQGLSYREIASKMGLSVPTVTNYVREELIAIRTATLLDAEQLRDMELERCDMLLSKCMRGVNKGDPASIGTALRIIEKRSSLLGLDAPKRTEWIGQVRNITKEEAESMTDDDLAARAMKIAERLAGMASIADAVEPPMASGGGGL